MIHLDGLSPLRCPLILPRRSCRRLLLSVPSLTTPYAPLARPGIRARPEFFAAGLRGLGWCARFAEQRPPCKLHGAANRPRASMPQRVGSRLRLRCAQCVASPPRAPYSHPCSVRGSLRRRPCRPFFFQLHGLSSVSASRIRHAPHRPRWAVLLGGVKRSARHLRPRLAPRPPLRKTPNHRQSGSSVGLAVSKDYANSRQRLDKCRPRAHPKPNSMPRSGLRLTIGEPSSGSKL